MTRPVANILFICCKKEPLAWSSEDAADRVVNVFEACLGWIVKADELTMANDKKRQVGNFMVC